jgi:hypothetical protein
MYLLLALAEKAGIQPRLYGDEEEDLTEEEEAEIASLKAQNLADIAKDKVGDMPKVPSGVLPSEIVEEIENLEVPESLLSPAPQMEEAGSLLAPE